MERQSPLPPKDRFGKEEDGRPVLWATSVRIVEGQSELSGCLMGEPAKSSKIK